MCKQNVEYCDVFLGDLQVNAGGGFNFDIGQGGSNLARSSPRFPFCHGKTIGPLRYCDQVLLNKKVPKMNKPVQNPLGLPTCEVQTTKKFRICDRCQLHWQKIEKAEEMSSPNDPLVKSVQGTPEFYNHWTARRYIGQTKRRLPQTQAVTPNGNTVPPQQNMSPNTKHGQPRGKPTQQVSNRPPKHQTMNDVGQYQSTLPPFMPVGFGIQQPYAELRPSTSPKKQLPQMYSTPPSAASKIPTQSAANLSTPGQWNRYQTQYAAQLMTPTPPTPAGGLVQQTPSPFQTRPPIPHTSQAGMPVLTSEGYSQQFPQQMNGSQVESPVFQSQMPTPPQGMSVMYSNGCQQPSQPSRLVPPHRNPYQQLLDSINRNMNGMPPQGMPLQPSFSSPQTMGMMSNMATVPGVPNDSQQLWQQGGNVDDNSFLQSPMTPLQPTMAPDSSLGYCPPSSMTPDQGYFLPGDMMFPGQQQNAGDFLSKHMMIPGQRQSAGVTRPGNLKRKASNSLNSGPLAKRG